MQKGARIEVLTRNSRLKQAFKDAKLKEHKEWKEWHRAVGEQNKDLRKRIKNERAARREDWLLANLAPNRDHGTYKGAYGTLLGGSATNLPDVPDLSPRQLKLDGGNGIAKGMKNEDPAKMTMIDNVIYNDRVVIVEGPARLKGLVGKVASVNKKEHSITIKDVNTADVRMGYAQREYSKTEDIKDPPLFNSTEIPIPIINVRLVANITDPATGRKKPVIVRHVHAGEPYSERTPYQTWPSHTRYATGTAHLNPKEDKDLVIEWPEEFPEEAYRATPSDTSRSDAETQSWYPDMDHSPLCYPTMAVQAGRPNNPEQLAGRYTAGRIPEQPKDMSEAIGMHGFADRDKLKARQNKIAAGIFAELKGTGYVKKTTMADEVKKRLLEDARAIWWSERQLLSPAAEAVKKAHEERRRWSAATLASPSGEASLPQEVQELASQLQTTSMKDRYEKADAKLLKKLRSANRVKGVDMDVASLDPKLPTSPQSATGLRVEFV